MIGRFDAVPGVHATTLTSPDDTALDERIACEHADRCGGCPILELTYGEQLGLKRGRVVRAVARYAALELTSVASVIPAQRRVGYRTRAKLIVAPGGRVGLFAKGGGHDVVDIPGCRVLDPLLARVAAHLRQEIQVWEGSGALLAPFETAGRGCLRAIDLRKTEGDEGSRVLVTFVVDESRVSSADDLKPAAAALMTEIAEVDGVAASFHAGEGPQVLGGKTVVLAGHSSACDRTGPFVHWATFGSFVQAHRGQAERLHRILADAAVLPHDGPPRRVLDLYGGSGAIAFGLAALGAEVKMVESFAPAAEEARVAARAHNLDVEVQCADASIALADLRRRGERFEVAITNPPRRGMSPAAREGLAELSPSLIAYVSCDPDTLARDLDHFARLGYSASTLRPLDMMPLTDHVEVVALLRRSGAPVPRVVYEDGEVIIVEKAAHEPTVPRGDYAGSLLSRARRLPGMDLCAPVHTLDVGTSGLVMFVRHARDLEKWEHVRSAPTARAIFLVAVRGVAPAKGTVSRDLRVDGTRIPARTRFRRLAIASGHSLLRAVPDRERTHQIRRHLAAIGHPVLGDHRYGHPQTNRHFEEKHSLDRTFVHCVRLEFDHPETGVRHVIESPLPGDLRSVMERVGGPGTVTLLTHRQALGAGGASSVPPGAQAPDDSPLDVDLRSRTMRPEPDDDSTVAEDD